MDCAALFDLTVFFSQMGHGICPGLVDLAACPVSKGTSGGLCGVPLRLGRLGGGNMGHPDGLSIRIGGGFEHVLFPSF